MFSNSIFINFSQTFPFLDSATPIMEGIVDLHNYVFFYLTLVLISVGWFLGNIIFTYCFSLFRPKTSSDLAFRETVTRSNSATHGALLEII
jgi:Cytochrome C oxidase subunit II, transmembrane domain